MPRRHCLSQRSESVPRKVSCAVVCSSLVHQAPRRAEATLEGYGVEVAFLSIAKSAAEYARRVLSENTKVQVQPGPIARVVEAATERFTAAYHDNTTVYRQPVPTRDELPPVEGTLLAKPSPLPDLKPATGGADLLGSLVPPAVTSAVSQLETLHQTLVASLREESKAQGDALRASLSEMGLPSSLDAGEATAGIPDSLWSRIDAVRIHGGLGELRSMTEANSTALAELNKLLNQVQETLKADYMEHEERRAQFGERWTPVDHRVVMSESITKLVHFLQVLKEAARADEESKVRLRTASPLIDRICKGDRASLAASVPEARSGSGGAEERNALRVELAALTKLMDEQPRLLERLSKTVSKADFSRVCLAKTEGGPIARFTDEMLDELNASFEATRRPVQDELEENSKQLRARMERITVLNGRYRETRAMDPASTARQAALQELNEGINKFDELRAHLRSQKEILSDIHAEVSRLLQNVQDEKYVRDLERREVLVQLGAAASDGASASRAAASVVAPPPASAP
jgi:programmed cell death 6-interacting protein